MARQARKQSSRRLYRFRFLGFVDDGWYALRADLSQHPNESEFYNEVIDWLYEQVVTPNEDSHVTNGTTGDGPLVPALANGRACCVLFRRPADVIRFSEQFPCDGIDAHAMMAALRKEAAVPRIWISEIAEIAYAAVRRYHLLYHRPCQPWEQLSEAEQTVFRADVAMLMEHVQLNDAERHEMWLQKHLREGWRFGAMNRRAKRHPAMVPFAKLSPFEAGRFRIVSNMVTALMPVAKARQH